MNLCQHAQNQAVSFYSGEKFDLKILQSDWLRAFWPIPQKQNFPKYGICVGNNINFHYRTNSVKINDQIFL